MKVLDLFCCEGGASYGYVQSGLDLLAAVDMDAKRLKFHPYPDKTVCADWREALDEFAAKADLIHASPPCQRYSTSTHAQNRGSYPDLVAEVREVLISTGKPYVIENVPPAPLLSPVYLTGCMFGLTMHYRPRVSERTAGQLAKVGTRGIKPHGCHVHLERRRGFEANWTLTAPPADPFVHQMPVISVIGEGMPSNSRELFWNPSHFPLECRRQLMGMPWASLRGTAEAIPPAYARYIGQQFQLAGAPVCEVCLSRFPAKRSHARTCSARCRKALSRRKAISREINSPEILAALSGSKYRVTIHILRI